MEKIKLFLKGLIIGFGKIIPGVSGALFACIFGVYETIIEVIASPKKIKDNHSIILPLGIGMIFAIIFGSNLIKILLENYYIESMSLFIGMMSYSIIPNIKTIKNDKITTKEFTISLLVVILIFIPLFLKITPSLTLINNSFYEIISLILSGILDAISTIVPGISGSAILMLIGYYEKIISALALSNGLLSLYTLIPFFIGFVIGIYGTAKVLKHLFITKRNIMNTTILLFTIFSIFILIHNLFISIYQINIIISLLLYILGFLISYFLEKTS